MEKIAVILLANFVFFFRTLKFSYVSDDIPIYKRKRTFKNEIQKRWLQFIGDARIKPDEDHLVTLLIHAFICVLIYLAFGKSNASFLAALFFTFNPMNNQGSVWISGRGYTLPALCILISLVWPVLAPFLLLISCSFTIGFLSPLVIIGAANWHILGWLPFIWLWHSKKFVKAVKFKAKAELVTEDRTFHIRKLVLATKTIGFYMISCLFPHRIAFFHNFLQSCAGNEIMRKRAYSFCQYFWIGLTAILGFIIYTVLVPWSIIHWGLLWYFIGIAPFSNLRRNNQEIADRFCYIANIGLMAALGGVLVNFPQIALILLTWHAAISWNTMGMYKDDYWIVEYSVLNDPFSWFGWHTRALKRWDNQSYKEALIFWVMAKMLSPKEFKLLFNIAVVLRLLKQTKESDAYLKLAEENIIPGQEEQAKEIISMLKQGKVTILM